MNQNPNTELVKEIMVNFAGLTGLEPVEANPKRYLWTDAFAVCNFLELFSLTDDETYQDLALSLVDSVHQRLGRHLADDSQIGWIGSLNIT